MPTVALCTVVTGEAYHRYAEVLFWSAETYFRPGLPVHHYKFEGVPGWPDATMQRWRVLLENMPKATYVFLSDADMRFEQIVRNQVLPEHGIAATLHPGYVGRPKAELPYESNPESAACVLLHQRQYYYCGGFVGGTRKAMTRLARGITRIIDADAAIGHIPIWHDESALNKVLAVDPPELTLSPSYCYPDNDIWYKSFWAEPYERKLVALDKTEDERAGR